MKRTLFFLAACSLTSVFSFNFGPGRAETVRPKGRALLVGVTNYEHPDVRPTRGAEEDAEETAEFIKSRYGFLSSEVEVLKGSQATAKNILTKFQEWLINGTQPGDRVFFLYAGHGSRLPDDNKDEPDGFDETLAPYDVKPDGTNMIRDDELGLLIAQLSGRLAVLLFDSCHSGTITRGTGETKNKDATRSSARYLPSPAQLTAIGAARSRGGGSLDYTVQDLPEDSRLLKTRDLKKVKAEMGGPATGIVVISAAQSGQVAFSMDVGYGRQRGALSYVFTQLQTEKPLTLRELQQTIPTRIADLQREGRLQGKQKPVFEIISTVPLENKPLFGNVLTTPAVALANPQSAVKLSLHTQENKTAYRFGETVTYQVKTDTLGFLYLIVFSEGDVATCIFPNENIANNQLTVGAHVITRDGQEGFYVGEPAGKDVVVALLSATKLNLGGQRETYNWSEVFGILKNRRFTEYIRTRGQTSQKPAELTNWQAASLTLEAIP